MEAEAVRDQVGVKASRRRRAASSPAHGRHVAGVACRGQTTRMGAARARVKASVRDVSASWAENGAAAR
jgi:ribosomal protein S13